MPSPTEVRTTPGTTHARRELRDLLGATPTELDTLERQGAVVPSRRGPDGRTGLYDDVDVALAAVALHGFRIGIRGRALLHLIEAARTRAPRMVQGWRGWLVFDGHAVELCTTATDVSGVLGSYRSPTACVVVPVSIGTSS